MQQDDFSNMLLMAIEQAENSWGIVQGFFNDDKSREFAAKYWDPIVTELVNTTKAWRELEGLIEQAQNHLSNPAP